jgi:hypothetical protein
MRLIRRLLLGLAIGIIVVLIVGGPITAGLWGFGLTEQKLTAVGTYIYGVATAVLALATVVGGGFALLQWRNQLELRRRQTDLDVANLQRDVVKLLQEEFDRIKGTEAAQVVGLELDQAELEYEAILRGLMLARPELTQAKVEFVREYLKVVQAEIERLEGEIPGQRGDAG